MNEDAGRRVAVVGGGLAGLAASVYLARGGRRVTLYERAEQLGGRAATKVEAGFSLNLGPHAAYRSGDTESVLAELGVSYTAGAPDTSDGFAYVRGGLDALPAGPNTLRRAKFLSWRAKWEAARFLSAPPRWKPEKFKHIALRTWLDENVRHAEVRAMMNAYFRLTTYTDSEEQAAFAALNQLQVGMVRGVQYVDGGWRSFTDGLRAAAERAGVRIVAGARVEALDPEAGGFSVRLAGGAAEPAGAALVAASPETASALLPQSAGLRAFAAGAVPIQAAALDLGLARLPKPERAFCLGVDAPYYYSVHSKAARLAPPGGALVHLAKYLRPGETHDARTVESELEAFLDVLQPGWRTEAVVRRFIPALTVAHAMRLPGAARPGVRAAGVPGVYLAGDWVDGDGHLADASLGSARRAAAALLAET